MTATRAITHFSHRLRATVADLAAAQHSEPAPRPDDHEETALLIAECDRKLASYCAALDAGASPATVAAWIAETDLPSARTKADLPPRERTRGSTSNGC
jgi:hypothetical protein